MIWDRKVPFAGNDMLDYDGWSYKITEWRDAQPFEAELAYVDARQGRSAVRFTFRGPDGTTYSVAWKTFLQILPDMVKGRVTRRWDFAKQGANYGLVVSS